MRRLIFVPVVLFMLLLSVAATPAFARTLQPSAPSLPDATYDQTAVQTWPGPTWGVSVEFYLDNPYLAYGEGFERHILLQSSNGTVADFGIEKCASGYNCYQCHAVGYFEFLYWSGVGNWCFPLSESDPSINHSVGFSIQDNSSNDGLEFNNFNAPSGSNLKCQGKCSVYDGGKAPPAWNTIEYKEHLKWTPNYPGEHRVFGGYWANSSWRESTFDSWKLQTWAGSTYPTNPPQMYWLIAPSQQQPGGTLISCDYDYDGGVTTCKFRQ